LIAVEVGAAKKWAIFYSPCIKYTQQIFAGHYIIIYFWVHQHIFSLFKIRIQKIQLDQLKAQNMKNKKVRAQKPKALYRIGEHKMDSCEP